MNKCIARLPMVKIDSVPLNSIDSVPLNFNDSSLTDNQILNQDKESIHEKESEKCNPIELVESYSTGDSGHEKLPEKSQPKAQPPLAIFGTTFITIFLAEIGDKTQISTLMMSAQSHQPWVVFLGSAVALITTSLLGVALGSWVSNKLSPKTLEKATGVTLLLISLMLFGDVIVGW